MSKYTDDYKMPKEAPEGYIYYYDFDGHRLWALDGYLDKEPRARYSDYVDDSDDGLSTDAVCSDDPDDSSSDKSDTEDDILEDPDFDPSQPKLNLIYLPLQGVADSVSSRSIDVYSPRMPGNKVNLSYLVETGKHTVPQPKSDSGNTTAQTMRRALGLNKGTWLAIRDISRTIYKDVNLPVKTDWRQIDTALKELAAKRIEKQVPLLKRCIKSWGAMHVLQTYKANRSLTSAEIKAAKAREDTDESSEEDDTPEPAATVARANHNRERINSRVEEEQQPVVEADDRDSSDDDDDDDEVEPDHQVSPKRRKTATDSRVTPEVLRASKQKQKHNNHEQRNSRVPERRKETPKKSSALSRQLGSASEDDIEPPMHQDPDEAGESDSSGEVSACSSSSSSSGGGARAQRGRGRGSKQQSTKSTARKRTTRGKQRTKRLGTGRAAAAAAEEDASNSSDSEAAAEEEEAVLRPVTGNNARVTPNAHSNANTGGSSKATASSTKAKKSTKKTPKAPTRRVPTGKENASQRSSVMAELQQNDDAIVSQSQSRPRSSASGRARTPSRKARENDESQAVQDAAAAVKDLRRSSRRVNTQCAELYEDLERVEATQET